MLVMIPKATQSSFWNAVRRGGEQAAEEFDVELLWKGPSRENDRRPEAGRPAIHQRRRRGNAARSHR